MEIINVEKAWRLMDGDAALYRELFAIIERSLSEKYGNIERALNAGSAEYLELYAHQLKGALRNVAADKVCEVLFQLERTGATADLTKGRELYTQVRPLVEEALATYRSGAWVADFSRLTQGK